MQTSRSFEYARTGRPRPTNLLSANGGRSNSYELPWPSSPSFNPEQHGSNASSSGQKLRSPLIVDGLPPTPITAGLPIHDNAGPTSSSSSSPVRLPSINAMLATAPNAAASTSSPSLLTPPSSTDLTLPPAPPTLGGSDFDADEGRFAGPPPQWVQDAEATFVGVRPPAASTSGISGGEEGQRLSSRAFNEVVHPSSAGEASSPLVGLGFAPCQETPRPDQSSYEVAGLSTPTQSSYYHQQQHAARPLTTPRAPSVQQSGVFPTVSPTSPALNTYWNTDLRTVSGNTPQRFLHQRPRPVRFASSGMQRETTVQVEPMSAQQQMGWPTQAGVYGLGISLDGTGMQGVEAEASSSAQRVQVDQQQQVAPAVTSLPAGSTGLTPSLHATRILADITQSSHAGPASPSPSLRTKSKQRSDLVRREAEAAAAAAAAGQGKKRRSLEGERPNDVMEVEQAQPVRGLVAGDEGMPPPQQLPRAISPSKGAAKKNSNSAAALTSSGSAGSTSSSSSSSKKSSTSSKSRTTMPGLATFKSTPPASSTGTTPSRQALSSRSTNTANTTSSSSTGTGKGASTSSPWGVFRVKPHGEWKPLAPPGGGQGAASKAAAATTRTSGGGGEDGGNKKQKRAVGTPVTKVGYEPSSTKHLAKRPASAHGHYSQEDKENVPLGSSRRAGDVFGSGNGQTSSSARRPSSSSGSGRPGSASGVRRTTTFVGGLR